MCLTGPLLSDCNAERASQRDCEIIMDRIVELELMERGFRDPVLLEKKQRELRRSLAAGLGACRGRRLPEHALACVRAAKSSEEISHVCLH
jgi:hypothetical protein